VKNIFKIVFLLHFLTAQNSFFAVVPAPIAPVAPKAPAAPVLPVPAPMPMVPKIMPPAPAAPVGAASALTTTAQVSAGVVLSVDIYVQNTITQFTASITGFALPYQNASKAPATLNIAVKNPVQVKPQPSKKVAGKKSVVAHIQFPVTYPAGSSKANGIAQLLINGTPLVLNPAWSLISKERLCITSTDGKTWTLDKKAMEKNAKKSTKDVDQSDDDSTPASNVASVTKAVGAVVAGAVKPVKKSKAKKSKSGQAVSNAQATPAVAKQAVA
jgi:hypothetical protein